jgi:signal transduction histidine kinase
VLDPVPNRRSIVAPAQPKTLAPLYWGAIVTTIIAAGITLAIFWLGGRTQNEDEWIRRTLALRAELHEVNALVIGAESSQRGYLLTGRTDYLSHYTPAVSALQDAINRAGALVRDSPQQVEAMDVLRRHIAEKLEEMQTTIDERNAGHADAALALVNTDRGKLETTVIRDQIDAMVETENALLTQREREVASLVFFLQVGSGVAFLLIGGVGLLVAYFARRSLTAIQSANLQLSAANQNLLDEINQREQAESQLRQSQKMDAIGQLTGGIAHDFNNMLGVVIGSLDMIRRRMKTDEFGVSRFIDSAMKATERSAALTQRLLAFARQQPLAPEPVDANRMITEMSDMLHSTLGEHIQIEAVTAAGLWKTSVDVHQLENAIVNVALNARDAMPDGGKLTIETANVYLDEDYCRYNGEVSPGQFVMVAVTDEGVGMDPQVAARVFDPFFTTKPAGKGTGLGLSQVYGFIKQSQGHVKIYSELGTGTTVKIYLPRLRGRGDEIPRLVPQEVKGDASETILVVEDDPLMRRVSTDLLRELGYTVIESESGAEALTLLEATPGVTLLFTDVVMPEMNGKKLAEAALQRRPDLKVLFTTGYSRNAVVHGGVLDPDINFISKPFAIRQLASKVRAVLDR